MTAPSIDRLLSVRQVAELLSISTRSVRRLLPRLGVVRVGGCLRIPESCLRFYYSEQFRPPEKDSHARRHKLVAPGNVAIIVDKAIDKHRRRA